MGRSWGDLWDGAGRRGCAKHKKDFENRSCIWSRYSPPSPGELHSLGEARQNTFRLICDCQKQRDCSFPRTCQACLFFADIHLVHYCLQFCSRWVVTVCRKVEEANAHLHHDKMVKNPSVTLIDFALFHLITAKKEKEEPPPWQVKIQDKKSSRAVLTSDLHQVDADSEKTLGQQREISRCPSAPESEDTEPKIL